MCRSIKTLRPPVTDEVGEDDIRAAALQYVRKVSGFRQPAAHNREAFDRAVEAVAEATRELLGSLEIRGRRPAAPGAAAPGAGGDAGTVGAVGDEPAEAAAEPAEAAAG